MSDNDNNKNTKNQDDIDITTDADNTESSSEEYQDYEDMQESREEFEIGETEIDETDEADGTDAKIPKIKLTQEMIDAGYFLPDEEKKRFAEELFDWIEIFSSALLTVILLFTFIFRLVTVQGPSMEYTLHGGEKPYSSTQDNLIISNLFYKPKQGDIVVIQVPNPSYPTPIIKRVIAVEGQTVDFDFENWIVYVDGKPIYEVDGQAAIEPYVNYEPGKFMNGGENVVDLPITIEKGKIFVMGDNRNRSSDSRSSGIGQVDVINVVGRVLIRVFPFSEFGVVKPNVQQ